ncbi:hypothetical protein CerSpe_103550 [Prunus speciosa]
MAKRGADESEITDDDNINGKRQRTDPTMAKMSEITNDDNINGKRQITDPTMAKMGAAESEVTNDDNINGKRQITDPTMAKMGAAESEITNDDNINGKRQITDPTMAKMGAAESEITNDNNINGKRPRTDPTMAKMGAAEIEITNDNNINGKRPSKRQRRVEIKKVEEKNKRHVTFSKRKRGLFNKAAELSVLSGAETAGIVVSSNGKVFCFGSPSVDTVIHRYLGHNASSLLHAGQPDIHHVNGEVRCCPYNISSHVNTMRNGNKQVEDYMEARRHMEVEKIKRVKNNNTDNIDDIDNNIDGERGGWCYGWWEKPIEMTTSLEELEEYMAALRQLKHNVEVRTNQMVMNVGYNC